MFDCRQVLAELGAYLDDEAAAEIRAALEAHLAECRSCHVLVDSTRKTLKLVTESRSFELPSDLTARVLERIRTQGGKP